MHIGKRFNTAYFLQDDTEIKELASSHTERDLGVYIQDDLKWADQCGKAAAKANSVFSLIHRYFKYFDCDSFLILYKTYVRPQLEYCVQLWSPSLVKDIECILSRSSVGQLD